METMSERLKRLRKEKDFSIAHIAREINVSPSTYRTWEGGAEIQGEPYIKLADVFSVSLSELLTGNKNQIENHLLEMESLIKKIRADL